MAENITEPTQMLSTLMMPPEGAGARLKLAKNRNFSYFQENYAKNSSL